MPRPVPLIEPARNEVIVTFVVIEPALDHAVTRTAQVKTHALRAVDATEPSTPDRVDAARVASDRNVHKGVGVRPRDGIRIDTLGDRAGQSVFLLFSLVLFLFFLYFFLLLVLGSVNNLRLLVLGCVRSRVKSIPMRLHAPCRRLLSRRRRTPRLFGEWTGLDDGLHQLAHVRHLVSDDPHAAFGVRAHARGPGAKGQVTRRAMFAHGVPAGKNARLPQAVMMYAHIALHEVTYEASLEVRVARGLGFLFLQ